MEARQSIRQSDVVTVQGRYLVIQDAAESNATTTTRRKGRKRRFFMKGIAFPIQIPMQADSFDYDVDGWIDVLEQLATLVPNLNTVRLYQVDCRQDYSRFLHRAQQLGIYVIVPFTSTDGKGVLNRNKHAPRCYSRRLFHYGMACIDNFSRYPNVLAGMIGNEVMNSIDSWEAAPCVAAYARDLKLYAASVTSRYDNTRNDDDDDDVFSKELYYRRHHRWRRRPSTLPLMYAAQHDAVCGAVVSPQEVVQLNLDYLTCSGMSDTIDLFGINIESWCSSLNTFELNEDGWSENAYHGLYQQLQNTTVPLVFSEMGCSKQLFNRDNGLERYNRDWKQIPIVLGPDMNELWSGFCAYAYDGNPLFRMMETGPWNGHDILQPGVEFENFQTQMEQQKNPSVVVIDSDEAGHEASCGDVLDRLSVSCSVDLYPMSKMPSYFNDSDYNYYYYYSSDDDHRESSSSGDDYYDDARMDSVGGRASHWLRVHVAPYFILHSEETAGSSIAIICVFCVFSMLGLTLVLYHAWMQRRRYQQEQQSLAAVFHTEEQQPLRNDEDDESSYGSTLRGNGSPGSSSDDGPARSFREEQPHLSSSNRQQRDALEQFLLPG